MNGKANKPCSWLVSHPTGNANVRGLLAILQKDLRLQQFFTTVGFPRYSRAVIRCSTVLNRRYYDLPGTRLSTFPLMECMRFASGVFSSGKTSRQRVDELYRKFDQRVADALDKYRAQIEVAGIYAYEDGALEQFRRAESFGWPRLYELPIGYWREARRILQEEAERLPEWASTMPALNEPDWKLERKDREIELADAIVVASSFTAKTLQAYPGQLPPIHTIPYGSPIISPSSPEVSESCPNGTKQASGNPLKALFVGGLSQRKGLHYLFEAADMLGESVEWTIIGRGNMECKILAKQISRYRWIPSLPHREILEQMRQQDVLVFPSLFEGFGLVIVEALASGIPVITTAHTAGPDLFADGEAGFIVPIRCGLSIADRLEILHRNRELLQQMKINAREAAKRWTWGRYQQLLLPVLNRYG
jgi:glycosyltransferase involved in cell wall biosynthesis